MIIPIVCVCWASADVRPASDRIDAIIGQPLVLALVGDDVSDFRGGVDTRLDDGRVLKSGLFRLSPSGAVDGGWIGPVPRWSALSASDAFRMSRIPAGAWYASVPLPIDAVGQGLWFDGVRYELNWLPDPERAALEAEGRPLWASPIPDAARGSAELARAMESIAGDPFQRWRTRLVRDGIAPAGERERTGPEGSPIEQVRADVTADEAERFLESLAVSHEARWQLILGRLALIDEEVAARMRRRLAGVALIGGRWVPCWSPDSLGLRRLQRDLLSPFVDDQTRALRALAWLDAQPKSVIWVIDDAGEQTADRRLEPTLGVLSLPARLSELLVAAPGAIGGPELITAPPRESIAIVSSVAMVEKQGRTASPRTNTLEVRVGRNANRVKPAASIPGARPPGFEIGPLLSDWSMPAILSGDPRRDVWPEGTRTTAGLLRRSAPPDAPDDAAGWSLYLACAGRETGDAVTVWAGPFGLPRGVWRVLPDGTVRTLFGPSPSLVTVVPIENGWAFDLALPASVIGPDGVLRLGVERGWDGHRAAWPRRMLPWQDEPGRLPIDTRAWSGL